MKTGRLFYLMGFLLWPISAYILFGPLGEPPTPEWLELISMFSFVWLLMGAFPTLAFLFGILFGHEGFNAFFDA